MEDLRLRGLLVLTLSASIGAGCVQRELPAFDADEIDVDLELDELPPGDAEGSGFDGRYEVTATEVACEGRCELETEEGVASDCRLGETSESLVALTHDDGALTLLVDATPDTYGGSMNADGSFDAVGEATEDERGLQLRNRVVGDIDGGGALTAIVISRRFGQLERGALDCRHTYDIRGQRVD